MKLQQLKILSLFFISLIAFSCNHQEKLNSERKRVVSAYFESYNNYDFDGMTKNLDHNIVYEHIREGEINTRTTGISEFKESMEAVKEHYAYRKQTITGWTFINDTVEVKIDFVGEIVEDVLPYLQKGDTIKTEGTSKFYFDKNKVVKIVDKG